jgi:hypothetical protein
MFVSIYATMGDLGMLYTACSIPTEVFFETVPPARSAPHGYIELWDATRARLRFPRR